MSSLLWYPGQDLLLGDIVRAENCYLYDSEGAAYVDLESGVWCTSIGHGNPRLLRVLAEQAARIAHTGFNYSCPVVEDAARDILSLHDFEGGRCVFLCSGSEAVEYGVRVAKSLSERPLFMTMADSYFGAYGSASMKREEEWFRLDWSPCADCPDSIECGESCEVWRGIPMERIGGFLFEPGSSSGLVRFPPGKLIRAIADSVRADGGLYLVNEVTTGVGRTGKWFGYQHYGIPPDVVAMGKGIGNGYPVSATAFSRRVADLLGERPIPYAQSHQNDPLGAALAREVIKIIQEEGLLERAAEVSTLLLDGLKAVAGRTGRIAEVRGRGLMAAVDLVDDAECSLAVSTQRELVGRGFVLARRSGLSVLRLDPALTIERVDIERFLLAFEEVLD